MRVPLILVALLPLLLSFASASSLGVEDLEGDEGTWLAWVHPGREPLHDCRAPYLDITKLAVSVVGSNLVMSLDLLDLQKGARCVDVPILAPPAYVSYVASGYSVGNSMSWNLITRISGEDAEICIHILRSSTQRSFECHDTSRGAVFDAAPNRWSMSVPLTGERVSVDTGELFQYAIQGVVEVQGSTRASYHVDAPGLLGHNGFAIADRVDFHRMTI